MMFFERAEIGYLDIKFEESFICAHVIKFHSKQESDNLGLRERKIKLIRRGLANWPVRANFELCSNSRLELIKCRPIS